MATSPDLLLNNGWNNKIESLANEYLSRSIARYEMHYLSYSYYRKKYKLFKWIGSLIMALAGISGISIPGNVSELTITVIFIVIILFGFAIQWYGENEEYNEVAQQHLAYSDHFRTMVDDIKEQLVFSRSDRQEGKDYINKLKVSFNKYKDMGPSIPQSIELKIINKNKMNQPIQVIVDTNSDIIQNKINEKLKDTEYKRDLARFKMGLNYELNRFKSSKLNIIPEEKDEK